MNRLILYTILFLSALCYPGCELIGDIFKAGIWVGIIIVIAIVAVIALIIRMFKN
ncbi:MAG TPA: phosphatidate cytidylyltransferase [Ignavibacteria bacterium]|nr:phosphatidate cytidylyltransferase [Ignavibacteria bacterium]